MKLRTKIFLPLASLVLILGIYINMIWTPTIIDFIKQEEIEHITSHLQSVNSGLVPLLLENQLANVYDNLNTVLKNNPSWVSLRLYNNEQQLIFPLNDNGAKALSSFEVLLTQEINYLQHNLGKIELVVDFSGDIEQFTALKNQMLMFFTVAISIFVVGILLVLRYVVHKPLEQMTRVFDNLANGRFDFPLPKISKDEIGHLIKSADSMRGAVEQYQSQLKREITDHKVTADALFHEKERASYQATHDPLTNLANRREFEARLKLALELAQKHEHQHALAYIDLDQFKVVNDTCGHVAGDALLKQLSIILKQELRSGDTLARLGGDEFGVLLENCNLAHAEARAVILLKAVQDFHFDWQGSAFRIGASIGLVPIDHSSQNIESLLSAADTACYAAKDLGRNRIHVYHYEDAELTQRAGEMQWVSRITLALKEDRFVLYCQPVTRLGVVPAQVVFAEVLLRLRTETGELIPPGAFLPAAERFNMISHIDFWVIDAVFRYLHQHKDTLIHLSVNLSGQTLSDKKLLPHVINCFNQYQISGEQLCFEITESAAVSDIDAANHFIHELKQYGCRFAMDDFGRGLSSLVYLKKFDMDYLKIDGLFVKDINQDPLDLAMIRSINDIGHLRNMTTIAEFVEDEGIYNKLLDIGVDCAQGYWLSEPYPLDDHIQFLGDMKFPRLVNDQ